MLILRNLSKDTICTCKMRQGVWVPTQAKVVCAKRGEGGMCQRNRDGKTQHSFSAKREYGCLSDSICGVHLPNGTKGYMPHTTRGTCLTSRGVCVCQKCLTQTLQCCRLIRRFGLRTLSQRPDRPCRRVCESRQDVCKSFRHI